MKNLILVIMVLFSTAAFASEKKLIVEIPKMSCPACVGAVKGELGKFAVIKSIDISLGTKTATLVLQDGKDLDAGLIKKAVKKAGFTATSVTVGI